MHRGPVCFPEQSSRRSAISDRTDTLDKSDSGWDRRTWIKLAAFGVLLAGLGCVLAILPVGPVAMDLLNWTGRLGFWGPVLLGAFFLPTAVLMIPGGLITLAAGFLFGPFTGTVVVSIGSTLGAAAAFVVGRTFGRTRVLGFLENRPTFQAIDQAVGQEGFKIVLLTRMSPIFPYNFLNYAYGLTDVPFARYVLASWLGMLPGTIVFVYIGTGLRALSSDALDGAGADGAGKTFFWLGLAVTFIVAILITRIATKAIRESIDQSQGAIED